MRNRVDKKLQTDRWTDGPTDKLTPIYPPNRVLGGIKKESLPIITSHFSFFCSVLKRIVLQTRKNHGLLGKGLLEMAFTFSNLDQTTDLIKNVTQMFRSVLTLSQTTNFRLFQIERHCRQQLLLI